MALSLFRPKEAPTARDALNEHLARVDAINAKRTAIGTRFSRISEDMRQADDLGERILKLRETIDTAEADARFDNQPEPGLSKERRQLDDLASQFVAINKHAQSGKALWPRLHAENEALTKQFVDLKPTTDRLLWEAVLEEMAGYATELAAAEAMFRDVHRKAFAAATAADKIADASKYGQYVGSALYSELNISKPIHAAFWPDTRGPEAQQAARIADVASIGREADDLINSLLGMKSEI